MKILCNYNEHIKEMYFEKIVFFHGNHDNLNTLYQTVLNGLNGQDKSFLLNNQIIEKKELNVIEFDNNGIIDDLKFTAKSYFSKLMQTQINTDELEEIKDEYDLINVKLANLVAHSFCNLHSKYMFINPHLSKFCIEKYIQDNFSFVNKEEIDFATNTELQLCIVLEFINSHPETFYHVLIKDLDRNLDLSQILYIIEIMKTVSNASFYIFLRCFELYEAYHNFEQYLVLENTVLHRVEEEQNCIYSPLLTLEENEYYSKAMTYLKHKKLYDESTSKHPEIFKSDIIDVI